MKNKTKTLLIKIKELHGDTLVVYGIIIIAASFASIGSSYIVNRIKTAEKPIPSPTLLIEKPSVYPDYDVIKGTNPDPKIKPVNFTEDCQGGGCVNYNPATKDFDGIKKNYSVKGKISRAYLYVEVAVDKNRPLTKYDDFYFTMNYQGGHLSTDENLLPVPPSNISIYLYDLRSISYSYNGRNFKNVNFLNLLQGGANFNIHTSVSSDRPGRVLKEVSIYYECFENSECGIVKQK